MGERKERKKRRGEKERVGKAEEKVDGDGRGSHVFGDHHQLPDTSGVAAWQHSLTAIGYLDADAPNMSSTCDIGRKRYTTNAYVCFCFELT